MRFLRSAAIALVVLVTAAWITPKTITLSIPGMTCATCPITIKAALKQFFGVNATKVRTMQMRRNAIARGKTRGVTPRWKKAIVTRRDGDKIELI